MDTENLGTEIWTQRIDLVFHSVHEKYDPFQHTDELMEEHQLHRKHVDEDPEHLDRTPTLSVTHPALVIHEDVDAMDFSVQTVLKEAGCWMG